MYSCHRLLSVPRFFILLIWLVIKFSGFYCPDVLQLHSFFSILTTASSWSFYLVNFSHSNTHYLCHTLINDFSTRKFLNWKSSLPFPLFYMLSFSFPWNVLTHLSLVNIHLISNCQIMFLQCLSWPLPPYILLPGIESTYFCYLNYPSAKIIHWKSICSAQLWSHGKCLSLV